MNNLFDFLGIHITLYIYTLLFRLAICSINPHFGQLFFSAWLSAKLDQKSFCAISSDGRPDHQTCYAGFMFLSNSIAEQITLARKSNDEFVKYFIKYLWFQVRNWINSKRSQRKKIRWNEIQLKLFLFPWFVDFL